MPLVTAAVLAYAGGLLAALGDASGLAAVAVAGVAFVAWCGGRSLRDRLLLGALGVAAFATATVRRLEVAQCARGFTTGDRWRVTLGADAAPGAFVSGRSACGADVRLSVISGSAPAGSAVIVRGALAEGPRGPRGALIARAEVHLASRPGPFARWRARIGAGIDARFGADAPLVRALLIADRGDLSPTVRDRFAAAGLSHMLSVSGLHVGLIAMAVLLMAQVAGLARGAAEGVAVTLTGVYVVVIGAPLPAVRAAAMMAGMSASRVIQRPTSIWAVLAVGAAIPLVDPLAVLDVGYQLSVIGMVAIVASGALARRWRAFGGRGWRGTIARGVLTSVCATLLTAPLVAATFGRISVVAPLSNLAAVPVIGALQPMLFLAALLLPLGGAAQFVADACHPLLLALDRVASVASTLPGAAVPVLGDPTGYGIAAAAGAAFVVASVSRFPGRALLAGTGCLALLAWRPSLPTTAGATELHLLDVGQGDAIALRTRGGHWVLIDAGRDWRGGDAGARDVVPYVAARGGSVVAFILSHPHADHVGGAASVVRALQPGVYFDPGYAGGTTPYRASLIEARRTHTPWRRVRPGDSLVVDEATLTFLAPDSAWAESQGDPNLASSVVRIRVGGVAFLLTGDAEAGEEDWLLARHPELLAADVLKVAHHGSRTSSTPAFLDAVRPRLALISVGAGNLYGHPNPGVLQALAAHGAVTLRTDRLGTIVVRTDGRDVEVEAAGGRWPLGRAH